MKNEKMFTSKDKLNGFLVIDKAKGRSSFSSVFRFRQCFGRSLKVGHLGTLDPLATGVLVLAIGEATKLIKYLMGFDKVYQAEVEFGKISNTYDADGELEVVKLPSNFVLKEDDLKKTIEQKFSSVISQVPPAYSAKWVDGTRAYQLARQGEDVNLDPVEVTIHSFDLTEFDYPNAKFEIMVSSGTYIRSLIHDLGAELGCGAYIKELRRTKVGQFDLENALCDISPNTQFSLISIEEVVNNNFDRIDLDDVEYSILQVGRKLENRRGLTGELYSAYYQNQLKGILSVDYSKDPVAIKMEKTLHL